MKNTLAVDSSAADRSEAQAGEAEKERFEAKSGEARAMVCKACHESLGFGAALRRGPRELGDGAGTRECLVFHVVGAWHQFGPELALGTEDVFPSFRGESGGKEVEAVDFLDRHRTLIEGGGLSLFLHLIGIEIECSDVGWTTPNPALADFTPLFTSSHGMMREALARRVMLPPCMISSQPTGLRPCFAMCAAISLKNHACRASSDAWGLSGSFTRRPSSLISFAVHEVPVQAVELLRGHRVEKFQDEFLGLEMAGAVEVKSAPGGGGDQSALGAGSLPNTAGGRVWRKVCTP